MKLKRSITSLAAAVLFCTAVTHAQTMTIVNGASFIPGAPLAVGSFASMFGPQLCSQSAAGHWTEPGQLPTELGGCSVTVNGRVAMMHYASPDQVNFIVPEGIASGVAQVVMHTGSATIQGTMMVGAAGPGVFSVNGMGMGPGAILHGTMWQSGPFSAATGGQPTPVSIYVTGLDLSSMPVVEVGGLPVEVTWFGAAPGFVGLQQINITLSENMAGAGMVPVTVASGGVVSNVTYMNVLPTTEMMQGTPGWGPGMMVGENMHRGRETSDLAYNASNNTALVTDEEDDALRVISMDSFNTVQTITLPDASEAHSVAVNAQGTLAAVALSHNASVALINLQQANDMAIIGTGSYPRSVVFAGADLLVTNAGSGTVTVIDTATRNITRTVPVGFGPTGIAVDETRAVVVNMQAGSFSVISLADYSVSTVDLPLGTRPHGVAIDSALNKAVITTPMSNGLLIVDLTNNEFTHIATDIWDAMGPGAVAIHNARAYVANQMTASVTVVDLNTNAVMDTFAVDPGPRGLAIDSARNRLLVLSQATGVLRAVDLNSFATVGRANATDGDRDGRWTLPVLTSIAPGSAQRGTTFTMTINGYNLQGVHEVQFHIMGTGSGMGTGGGMMGGGTSPTGGGTMTHDENIRISNLRISEDGSQLTITVEVFAAAFPGVRRVSLGTDRGEVMGGPVFNGWFTVIE